MKKSKTSLLTINFNNEKFILNSEKILVGSGDSCDIQIENDSISHYQAMIFISEDGSATITDLKSHNGTYINGLRVEKISAFFEGDTLTFGKCHLDVEESIEAVDFQSRESDVNIYSELSTLKVHIPEQTHEHEILIDDEYCDIVFNDEDFVPHFENPVNKLRVDDTEFIETDAAEEAFDIAQRDNGLCVQVTTAVSGGLQDQYYYPIQDGSIKVYSKDKKGCVVVDICQFSEPTTFFKISNNHLQVNPPAGFVASELSLDLNSQKVLVLTQGTFQIFIETAPIPAKLLHISSLKRDKAFFIDTLKKFSVVMLPLLLLLLVDFTIEKEKPVKKLSIIYKKPTKTNVDNSKSLASENPNNTKKDTGHKSTKQPDKKISHSKSGEKQKPKKSPKKAVAKASKPASKKAKAKTKAYKFKVATNVSSLFSNSSSVSVSNSKSTSNVKTTSNSATGSLNTKVNGTSSAQVGQLGKDSAGRGPASFGSKGLSSKAGRNTSYIQTQTVVLGSMDPELLRKILQQYLPQFRHCYQQELAYNSEDIKGVVDLNFEISGKGKVGKINIRAKDSRFSKRGINCMSKVLAIIDFPKPKGGGKVAVRQPLSFFAEKE